ncbi:MAG TPA: hypothetical protein VK726_16890 [Acetobacteraceae bacterium]|nr:hypothetical protein [Acetobacteraceae bacterium]
MLDDIRAGRLCRLLAQGTCEREQTDVVCPSRRHLPPRMRVLIDFFVAIGRAAEARFTHVGEPVEDDRMSPA